jgi:choline dehydrogenase
VTGVTLDCNKVTGIQGIYGKQREEIKINARKEVVLSAGAANTPKLLLLSGIGPREHLKEVGIAVRHDVPGVGENLQDHHMIRYVCRVKGTPTLNEIARGPSLLREIFRWCVGKPSILSISPSVCYAFWKSNPDVDRLDLQFHFSPGSYKEGVAGLLDEFPGMTLGFYNLRPKSVGTLRLCSKDPADHPIIQPNYIAHEDDGSAHVQHSTTVEFCRS